MNNLPPRKKMRVFELRGRIFGHLATLPQKGPEEEAPPTYSPSLIWAGESYIMVGNCYLLISNKINVASSARTHLSGSAVAGVLDEPYSQLTPLSGVELPYRPASLHRLEPCSLSILYSLSGRYGYSTELA